MNNAVITLKTDADLKNKAMKLAEGLGFSLSSLINAYLKQLVRTKAVNYSLQPEGEPTRFMIDSLKESAKERRAGRVVSFNTEKDALDYLDKLIDKNENRLREKVSKTTKKSAIKHSEVISRTTGNFLGQSA
jgi:antitoxin component of RelBE/YafQ-DinJ toxin-antitoxin module